MVVPAMTGGLVLQGIQLKIQFLISGIRGCLVRNCTWKEPTGNYLNCVNSPCSVQRNYYPKQRRLCAHSVPDTECLRHDHRLSDHSRASVYRANVIFAPKDLLCRYRDIFNIDRQHTGTKRYIEKLFCVSEWYAMSVEHARIKKPRRCNYKNHQTSQPKICLDLNYHKIQYIPP